jgi:His/Glu/Gln/Arg/opine family amino acid ABC transporter permease subunit
MLAFIGRYWDSYLVGLALSVVISAASMSISIPFGLLLALGRQSRLRLVRGFAGGYVAVFRALPPLLTLYFVFFALPTWAAYAQVPVLSLVLDSFNNRILAAVVAFALASAAFCTEIIRSGMESVPAQQLEAAKSIGMPYTMALRRIILPQALRIAFPPLGSEYIYVLKGTSLASVIGVVELMRTAQIAAGATFYNLLAYAMAGVYYVTFVIILQVLFGKFENRLPGRGGGCQPPTEARGKTSCS